MNKHYLITEILVFCCIFILCVASPVFTQTTTSLQVFNNWNFPVDGLFCFLIAVLILWFTNKKATYKPLLLRIVLPALNIFSFLFFISLIIKYLSMTLPQMNNAQTIIQLPFNFYGWLFCILRFFFGAFFEEVIYRFYIPDTLIKWIANKKESKVFIIIIEILMAVLFAAAHWYLGILSVVNALLAHAILRFFYKKNKSLIPEIAAHFCYNMISLILL